jgi:hypothetical protein
MNMHSYTGLYRHTHKYINVPIYMHRNTVIPPAIYIYVDRTVELNKQIHIQTHRYAQKTFRTHAIETFRVRSIKMYTQIHIRTHIYAVEHIKTAGCTHMQ